MRKLACELPDWPKKLDSAHLKAALNWLVEFTGSPPTPPTRLYGYKNEGEDHSGSRRNFAHLLVQLSDIVAGEAGPVWLQTAELLDRSGQTIQELNDLVVAFLLGKNHDLCSAGVLVEKSAVLEERAYYLLTELE